MDNYVNWGDWYSMQKDSIAEQIAKQQAEAEAQARADDERLTALQGQYETDYRGGGRKNITTYSDFLALEQEAKARNARAQSQMSRDRWGSSLGLQAPQGGGELSARLGTMKNDVAQWADKKEQYARSMREYDARLTADSQRQAKELRQWQDESRLGQLLDERERWRKQDPYYYRDTGQSDEGRQITRNVWDRRYGRSNLSQRDRELLAGRDRQQEPLGDWHDDRKWREDYGSSLLSERLF